VSKVEQKTVTEKQKKTPTTLDKKKLKISLLEEQIKELEGKLLRNQAELINYKRRKDTEVERLLKYANSELIKEILLVIDDFERAIGMDDDNPDDEVSRFLEGFIMINDKLKKILFASGVEEIDALGKPFDPNLHEAVLMAEDDSQDGGIVLEVLQKGYLLEDRIIRPAMVKVNKEKEKERYNE
jgi:molecular chaperone GrpE